MFDIIMYNYIWTYIVISVNYYVVGWRHWSFSNEKSQVQISVEALNILDIIAFIYVSVKIIVNYILLLENIRVMIGMC